MIRAENIVKEYQDFKLQCDFTLNKGVVSGIIGSNGAGKTTLFKLILDLISLDAGSIEVFNTKASELTQDDKMNLGVVFSDMEFSEYLNVKQIISILKPMYNKFDEALFKQLMTQFELPMTKPIKGFSTGMRAKLKTIIAVTHDAKLLILDEVTSGLDVVVRQEILDLLREYMDQNEDRSILISSHISSDLETLCDDIYLLKDGSVIMHETVDDLLNKFGVLKVSEEQFDTLDKSYMVGYKKESYGFMCLVSERQFYVDNHQDVVIEKSLIDDLLLVMIKGEQL